MHSSMKLGISSYAYAWAIGVPGWEPPVPMTAFDVLAKVAKQSIQVVQIADNLALDRLPEATLDALKAQADAEGMQVEVGTRGIAPRHLQAYLAIARRFGSSRREVNGYMLLLLRQRLDKQDERGYFRFAQHALIRRHGHLIALDDLDDRLQNGLTQVGLVGHNLGAVFERTNRTVEVLERRAKLALQYAIRRVTGDATVSLGRHGEALTVIY